VQKEDTCVRETRKRRLICLVTASSHSSSSSPGSQPVLAVIPPKGGSTSPNHLPLDPPLNIPVPLNAIALRIKLQHMNLGETNCIWAIAGVF
jgi:hypothetical protein